MSQLLHPDDKWATDAAKGVDRSCLTGGNHLLPFSEMVELEEEAFLIGCLDAPLMIPAGSCVSFECPFAWFEHITDQNTVPRFYEGLA